jgi:hypothetical protein
VFFNPEPGAVGSSADGVVYDAVIITVPFAVQRSAKLSGSMVSVVSLRSAKLSGSMVPVRRSTTPAQKMSLCLRLQRA